MPQCSPPLERARAYPPHPLVLQCRVHRRPQYDFIDGFARHMRDALPHASFIGFTGTPIELQDANTRAVFGDYISVYDIQRAVMDGATVPIYHAGVGRHGEEERHHRLDHTRQRTCPAPRNRKAHPTQVRLSARQAGEGHTDGAGTGGGAFAGVGGRVKSHPATEGEGDQRAPHWRRYSAGRSTASGRRM
jgi:hypothetical protein